MLRINNLHMTLIRLIKTHKQIVNVEFAKVGLSQGQPKILDFLSHNNGCIQRELAENCHIKPATVTSILASMERSGLIHRDPNTKDRRVLNVFITNKGKIAQRQVEKIFNSIDETCFIGFTEEEKKQTMHVLNRLYDNRKHGDGSLASFF